jgi:MFS superfamily sulfate permease-like transporter
MIYAFGNAQDLMSDSPSADLKRHVRYGHFTMDMVSATGVGGVPAKSNAVDGVSMRDMTRDHDRANLAHAVVGCLALFVLWPLNVLVAGFLKNFRIHVCVSGVLLVFLVVSYALGGVTSMEYNRVSPIPSQTPSFITRTAKRNYC